MRTKPEITESVQDKLKGESRLSRRKLIEKAVGLAYDECMNDDGKRWIVEEQSLKGDWYDCTGLEYTKDGAKEEIAHLKINFPYSKFRLVHKDYDLPENFEPDYQDGPTLSEKQFELQKLK